MIIKVCGLTRPADAAFAARAGVDWLGLNFWPRSKRFVPRHTAAEIALAAREARPEILLVGVFVDEHPGVVADVAEDLALDFVQFHGDEDAAYVARFGERAIKAIPVAGPGDVERMKEYGCPTFLLDTPSSDRGGSGQVGDWELCRRAAEAGRRVLLAGGLTPDNVGAAVATVRPFGVDVASGVESAPGVKDPELVERLVAAAREAARR